MVLRALRGPYGDHIGVVMRNTDFLGETIWAFHRFRFSEAAVVGFGLQDIILPQAFDSLAPAEAQHWRLNAAKSMKDETQTPNPKP